MVIAFTLMLGWLRKALGCHGSQDLQDYHDRRVLLCDINFQEGSYFALILLTAIVLRLT